MVYGGCQVQHFVIPLPGFWTCDSMNTLQGALYRLKTFIVHLKIRTLSHGNKAFRWQESENSSDRASSGDWGTVWIQKQWNTSCMRTNCYRSQNISPATDWWLIENALLPLGQKSLFAVTIYWIEVDFFIGLKRAVVVTVFLYSPCCICRLSPCILRTCWWRTNQEIEGNYKVKIYC